MWEKLFGLAPCTGMSSGLITNDMIMYAYTMTNKIDTWDYGCYA